MDNSVDSQVCDTTTELLQVEFKTQAETGDGDYCRQTEHIVVRVMGVIRVGFSLHMRLL